MSGDIERVINALRDLPSLEERQRREEEGWASQHHKVLYRLGWHRPDGYTLGNARAREAWESEHNPDDLLTLLTGGKADFASQRLAADIIRQAATKPLPKPKVDRVWRDRTIAECVYYAREAGQAAGDAYSEIADIFGLSAEHVRKVALHKDLMGWAEMAILQRRIEAKARHVR
jgi:hypothetical protein